MSSEPPSDVESRTLRSLSPMEEALTLTDAAHPMAVVCLVRFAAAPEGEAVVRAIEVLRRKHPLLRAHIHPWKGSYRFVREDAGASQPLRLLPREDDNHVWRVAEDELNRRVDPSREPLFQALLLSPAAPGGAGELVLRIHHAVIDGASLACLLDDLLRICAGEEVDESGLPLPVEPGLHELLPARYSGARGLVGRARFLLREGAAELSYRRRLRGHAEPPVRAASRCRIASIRFDQAETEALVRSARGRRVTLNGLLSASLLLATHDLLYGGTARPLRVLVWGSLRPYLRRPVAPEQLGAYVTLLRRDIDLNSETGIWSIARQVDVWTADTARRGQFPFGAIFSPMLMRLLIRRRKERMGATMLSYVGPVPLTSTYGPVEVAEVHAFITNNTLGPECAASSHISFGRLKLDLMLLETDLDLRRAAEMVARIESLLKAASAGAEAQNPDGT